MNKNKGVIGIGLVIAIVLGIVVVGGGAYYLGTREPSRYDGNWDEWQEKYNEENKIIEENQATPVEEIKSNLINDEVLGISFKINSGAVAQKGASRCCPSVWTISDNSGDQDTIEQYVVGSADDPKLWKVVTNMGTKKFGSNTYNVYKRNDGLFDFTIIKNDKAFVVNSFSNPAKFVDLSSFTINSSTKTTTSCTSDKGNVMTYEEALKIAKASSCNNVGTFTGEYGCNKNAGGLIDVYMKPTDKPICGLACRVSIDTKKAEEGWMCTGALKPIDDNLLKLPNCGVSLSKISEWSVISNTTNEIKLDIPGDTHTGFAGIDIKCVLSNTITDTDAKFGNITYFYDAGKKAWMETDNKEGEGIKPNSIPVLAVPLFTVDGLPVFPGTGRWLTYIVPISPSSILYLHEGDTEGGYTQTLTNLVKTLKKL